MIIECSDTVCITGWQGPGVPLITHPPAYLVNSAMAKYEKSQEPYFNIMGVLGL